MSKLDFSGTKRSEASIHPLFSYGVISAFSAILQTIFIVLFSASLVHAHNPGIKTSSKYHHSQSVITSNDFLPNGVNSSITNPNITVRLANPQYDCLTGNYCVDVEFQSDQEDQELFGMNVRFFYDDEILELDTFIDFQGGYSAVAPNPPSITQSNPGIGYIAFGFGQPGTGVFDFVNGAIEKTDIFAPPVYISTSEWTKLFKICFVVDDPDIDSANFCPPIVWDLEQDPTMGGYLNADDGVVITLFSEDPNGESEPALEHVVQFNWEYTGDGSAPPYGQPIETNCFAAADATIDASQDQGCYFQNRIFQPLQAELPNIIYSWNFGEGAVPAEAIGYGPHTVYYDTLGTKTVSLVVSPSEPGAQCVDSATISFPIVNCPAQISGTVRSVNNIGISGVNLRLYADADTNGIADDGVALRSVYTNSIGNYSMATITPGHYVIVQVQPTGWNSVDDGDLTDDGDAVENLDPLDNLIPVSLKYSELDGINYFIESASAGSITGSVFTDFDDDQFPDPGEGVSGVTIHLFADADTNGVADNNTPLSSQLTSSDGSYIFAGLPIGQYVISEVQPSGYLNVMDFDATNDNDLVPNSNLYNDTIPVTITNGETDANNYFIDIDLCSKVVTNPNDAGSGSLRQAIECAIAGDTVKFHPSLSGSTISITSDRLFIDKNIVIHSTLDPRVTIQSYIDGLFDIPEMAEVEFRGLNVVSGMDGNIGAAFNNEGILKLHNVQVLRNPFLPMGEYLIYNSPVSQLFLSGSCYLEMN